MKSPNSILLIVVSFLLSYNLHAQNNVGFRNYKGEFIKQFKVGLGWGFVETDQKPFYFIDGFSGWRGSFLPKTFHIEKRFNPHIRLNLGITHTKYAPRVVVDDEITFDAPRNYLGADLNVLYNFRSFIHYVILRKTWTLKNLHKEKFYFDGYFLGGIGAYNPIAIPTFNTGVGGDYWITYSWGINFQTVAKWSIDDTNRFHMHHQIGVVYHLDQGNDAGALKTLRRRQKRKRKKVKKAVIPEKREESSEDEESFDDFTE